MVYFAQMQTMYRISIEFLWQRFKGVEQIVTVLKLQNE